MSDNKESYAINILLPSKSEFNRLLAEYRTAAWNLKAYIEQSSAFSATIETKETASDI